tara:strand:- start:719 stop:1075 length:357 start_codon:yes stop_codon:yes gene_type:complete
MKWHDDIDALLGFCEWLDEWCIMFPETSMAIDMLRKPLRWYREYDAWQLWLEVPVSCERTREMILDAVIEGDEIDGEFADKVRESYEREQCGSKHHSFPTRLFNLVFGVTEPEEDDDE